MPQSPSIANPMLSSLAPELQTAVIAENQRKALADALLKQSLQYGGTPDTGRRIVPKTPAWAPLANAATTWLANKTSTEAQGKIGEAQAKHTAAGNQEIQRILSLPEESQTAAAMQSHYPQAQALAKALQERDKTKLTNQTQRLQSYGAAVSGRDPMLAGRALATGVMDSEAVPAPIPKARVEQVSTPTGPRPMVINTNAKGEENASLGSGGVTITNQMPGDSRVGVEALTGDLKPRQEAAAAAKNIYSATTRAVDALARGAQAGGGQNIKQNVRMVLQAFNVNAPETAETAELGMALGNALLTEAAKIKPISNTDIQTLEKIVGSIGTDPTALSRALAFSQAVALDALGNYNKWLQTQEGTVTDPIAKQRLSGSGVGYELPASLSGPMQHQLETMRQMQLFGGDISRFREPGGVNLKTGKPETGGAFPQDTQIQVNPAGGYPVGQAQTPAGTLQQPLTIDQLTPAQKAQLMKILQGG